MESSENSDCPLEPLLYLTNLSAIFRPFDDPEVCQPPTVRGVLPYKPPARTRELAPVTRLRRGLVGLLARRGCCLIKKKRQGKIGSTAAGCQILNIAENLKTLPPQIGLTEGSSLGLGSVLAVDHQALYFF